MGNHVDVHHSDNILTGNDACDPIIYTPEITPCTVLDPFAGSAQPARWRSSLAAKPS